MEEGHSYEAEYTQLLWEERTPRVMKLKIIVFVSR